jgi:hypothetical protein
VAACSGAQSTAAPAVGQSTSVPAQPTAAPAAGSPQQGGTLRIVWAVDVSLFDPATSGRGLARGHHLRHRSSPAEYQFPKQEGPSQAESATRQPFPFGTRKTTRSKPAQLPGYPTGHRPTTHKNRRHHASTHLTFDVTSNAAGYGAVAWVARRCRAHDVAMAENLRCSTLREWTARWQGSTRGREIFCGGHYPGLRCPCGGRQ